MTPPLSKTPLSAPVWVWLAYFALIALLGVLTGSVNGFFMVAFAAGFSFQFYCFAIWRGITRKGMWREP